jgi:hypothetical protein
MSQLLNKNFTVSFSGKDFPTDSHPVDLTIVAPNTERAKQWAEMQIGQWKLTGKDVSVKIEEVGNV